MVRSHNEVFPFTFFSIPIPFCSVNGSIYTFCMCASQLFALHISKNNLFYRERERIQNYFVKILIITTNTIVLVLTKFSRNSTICCSIQTVIHLFLHFCFVNIAKSILLRINLESIFVQTYYSMKIIYTFTLYY